MGVLGLWDVLESVGHPVKVEGLEGKVLGVDANIWLYKFIRGFRDKDAATNIDSHKLGLFNRISKLLFYRIKPVFVFDGPAPILKRRTLEKRQNIRNKTLTKVQDAAMRALANQIRSQYPNADIDHLKITLPELRSNNLVAAEKLGDEDFNLFYLPPGSEMKKDDCESDSEYESDYEIVGEREYSTKVDVNSKDFEQLPPEIRYEILQDVKAARRRIRDAGALPEDAGNFSNFQLERLRSRRKIQEKIEKCERDICTNYTGELADDRTLQALRVQSDASATILYRNNTYDPGRSGGMKEEEIGQEKPKIESTVIVSETGTTSGMRMKGETVMASARALDKTIEISSSSSSVEMSDPGDDTEVSPKNIIENLISLESRLISSSPKDRPEPLLLSSDSSSPVSSAERTSEWGERKESTNDYEEKEEQFNDVSDSERTGAPTMSTLAKKPPSPHSSTNDSSISKQRLGPEVLLLSSSSGSSDNNESVPVPKTISETLLLSSTSSPETSPVRRELDPPAQVEPVSRATNHRQSEQKTHQDNSAGTSEGNGAPGKDSSSQRVVTYVDRDLNERILNAQRTTNRVTTKIIDDAKELLRLFGIPYIDATGEAEAQCAKLEELKLTAGTITDDSDIWLFGAQNVFRYFFSDDKYVMQYKMTDIEYHIRMTRDNLVCFAMLVGSDYTEGIRNVGPVTALEILSEFPGESMRPLEKFSEWHKLAIRDKKLVGDRKRKKLLKYKLPEEFPSRAVFEGYLRPVADSSSEAFSWGTPELDELREYARRNFGWDQRRADEKLLPVMKKLNEKKIQKTIDTFFFKTQANRNPEMFRSKRVNQALNKIAKRAALEGAKADEEVNLSEDEADEVA